MYLLNKWIVTLKTWDVSPGSMVIYCCWVSYQFAVTLFCCSRYFKGAFLPLTSQAVPAYILNGITPRPVCWIGPWKWMTLDDTRKKWRERGRKHTLGGENRLSLPKTMSKSHWPTVDLAFAVKWNIGPLLLLKNLLADWREFKLTEKNNIQSWIMLPLMPSTEGTQTRNKSVKVWRERQASLS